MRVLRLRGCVHLEAATGKPALRQLIALELDAEQRRAVEAPFEECFAILGAPGTGKSTALAQRIARVRALHRNGDPLVLESPRSLEVYAAELLGSLGVATTLVDDVEAARIFAQACSPLFALQWEELARHQLDPEVPGLRSPQWFGESAFRLIRRLRDAAVEPAEFLSLALTGATEFYAHPPNFADPAVIAATKAALRDSLEVTPKELLRQQRREIDLAKILARLYEAYVELVRTSGRMTGRDATVLAAELLRPDAKRAAALRERHRFAFVDDAQELTKGQLRLLTAIYGERLDGVTLCGDPASAIASVRMTLAQASFAPAHSRVELRESHRTPRIECRRFSTSREEAEAIAERVGEWLALGVRPERIAVLFRSVGSVERYETALLDRNIPAIVAGDANVFGDRRALDALALLWNVYDPFRHDWLLRTLANPALGLSDASLAILCAEPPDPQRPLFAFDDEPAPTIRATRWDPKRDLRLGWNVVRGEQDAALSDEAAARIRRFRGLRERWLRTMHESSFAEFVRAVWDEGLAREGEPESARARAQQAALRRLYDRFEAFLRENPAATIADLLSYAEDRIESDLEASVVPGDAEGFVQLLSVEAALGREFERVVVANVRPGAFPRWYSPDSFLFSPRYGMIPKDNVGEASASRTAKFTYYMFRSKAGQHYYERERRAFAYAVRRASENVLVTASGTPTRGMTAPELLEELR
jgi:superfamily I DNA/RNA helicase